MAEPVARFEEVFRNEYRGIVRVVTPIVGSVEDAEAVAQDAFLAAFARWRRISGYDRPGAWVQRVAVRDAVRFARRSGRVHRRPVPTTDPSPDVAAHLDLHDALARLPARQRACVVLHHLADWPAAWIAEALGCRESTVRVHLHRARAALASSLAPEPRETPDGR